MKKLYSLLFSLLVIGGSALAAPKISEERSMYGYGDAFIFIEGGVEFAVYPDGQFDFFYNSRRNGYNVNAFTPNVNISYNAGYNYDPFVQFDDFGAVIQIEHVPVFYDYYGRIIQAGNVYLNYNHFGQLARVGGLNLHYNRFNQFTHYTGFINSYNPYYVYRPWHSYYMRPHTRYVVVHHQPYRAYYNPNRVTFNYHYHYYNNNYSKNKEYRRSYYRPGEQVTSYHRGSRVEQQRDLRPQRFNEDYTVATRLDDRNEYRSNADARRSATTERKSQSRAAESDFNKTRSAETSQPTVNRGREVRSSSSATPAVRESRSTQQRQPAAQKRQVQNTSREFSRDTGTNSRGRDSRVTAPAARNTSKAATMQAPARSSQPQAAPTGNSRSTRGRGN